MMSHEDCLFCKIIEGEIPSAKVYEDDHVYAFLDISQVTTGHTLVIPKKHSENIYETDEDAASKVFASIPKITTALKKAYQPTGLNVLQNNGAIAGQTVYHLHLHLIPRYEADEGFGMKWIERNDEFSGDDLQTIAQKIANEIV